MPFWFGLIFILFLLVFSFALHEKLLPFCAFCTALFGHLVGRLLSSLMCAGAVCVQTCVSPKQHGNIKQ